MAKQRRGIKSIIFPGFVGFGLAYFFDPDKGSRRRNIARDKARSWLRKVGMQAEKKAEYAAEKAYGTVVEKVPHRPDNPSPDDNTLRDRIESEVFRDEKTSRENININVAECVVEIRGELPTQSDIDDVIDKVRNVPNVKDVHNYLHLPGTPAPNKAEVLHAS
jgi:osmotically-inducible protein OsmY